MCHCKVLRECLRSNRDRSSRRREPEVRQEERARRDEHNQKKNDGKRPKTTRMVLSKVFAGRWTSVTSRIRHMSESDICMSEHCYPTYVGFSITILPEHV